MELRTTVSAKVRACATLEEDGTVSVKAFASADYAPGCTTTVSVESQEIPEKVRQAVAAALLEVQNAAAVTLGVRIQRAIAKSAEVAAAHGEI
jgi:coenzyme F420-reducing hydrogenase beta subunit